MNAERLRWLAEQLLAYEKATKVRKVTQQITEKAEQLAGNPQAQNVQTELASLIETLTTADESYKRPRLNPAQQGIVAELGGSELFGAELVAKIREIISRHGITVSVGAQELKQLQQAQQSFFDALEKVVSSFEALGIKANKLSPGEAEIGFLLPGDIYEHRLDKLGTEIETLSRMLRVIVEFQQGGVEEFRIRSIAASDLLIYLGMSTPAIIALGGIVTWGLDTIERILRIRKIVKDLRQEDMDEDALAPLETAEREKAETEAKQKAEEIAAASILPEPRKNELQDALVLSLQTLVARLERGMTVEIRLLPPPKVEGEAAEQIEAQVVAQQFSDLEAISNQLRVLPQVGDPILSLPAPLEEPPPARDSQRVSAPTRKVSSRR